MSMRTGRIFQFGKFQIDALTRTLRREDVVVKLNSRAFDMLLYLVQNPGKVLNRDELLKNAWPDACVDESSLAQNISLLRRALDEKPGDNSYIVTLPGRGYQFVSPVQVVVPAVIAPEGADGNSLLEVATAGRSNSGGLIFQKHSVETSVITTQEEKEQRSSPVSGSRLLIRTIAALLAAVVVVALIVRFRSPHPEQRDELVERQLTANPSENRINSSALSHDGKYLAYSDSLSKNLYLLAIDSGEIREVPLPGDYAPLEIRTSAPNVEVSRQVTGVRQDAYAKANPLVIEQEKEPRLRGFYIHPELYGAPAEKQIEWARHPQTMKKIQEMRAKQLAASQKQAAPRN
jgi:DNA-binding winged helix-turn-helix (wHTH) protein